jgi:hypothetical protein
MDTSEDRYRKLIQEESNAWFHDVESAVVKVDDHEWCLLLLMNSSKVAMKSPKNTAPNHPDVG